MFNAGEHPRRVAGVARSLGEPSVAARPLADSGSVVSIVVAWELCWYRYEVDLGDEAAGATVSAQGTELGELAQEERLVNADCRRARRAALIARLNRARAVAPLAYSQRGEYDRRTMIYCVVPKPLADELYPKLVEHYQHEDNVTVIVDRREFDRRARRGAPAAKAPASRGGAAPRDPRSSQGARGRGSAPARRTPVARATRASS